MSDVFISYRREDGGWAGRLHADIESSFDVFFDIKRDKIDYGDNFPERIENALKECSVCLVVIGPQWVSEKNLKRLANPRDYVRREIETALTAHPRVRTVPLMAGVVDFPPVEALPASLRRLPLLNKLLLTNENWTNDCEDLVNSARRWLGGQVAVTSARGAIPVFLPYLCDRVPQQEGLVDLISNNSAGRATYACIVHGHKLELHSSFLDRLRYQRVLERLFKARDSGLSTHMLQWNRQKAKAGQYADVLRRALKATGVPDVAASDVELLANLRRLAQPMVAVLQVTWPDYQDCGPAIVPGFIDAWHALFAEAAQAAGASRASTMPALLWINLTYDTDDQEMTDADSRCASVLLRRLEPVTQGDIVEWLAMDAVKRAMFGFESLILAMADDPKYFVEVGKVRMQNFVDNVRRIVVHP